MTRVTATEMKNRLGQYLNQAMAGPVMVEKSGRPAVVILSFEEYERLMAVEDAYWAEKALEAEKSGYLGTDKAGKLLKDSLGAEA